MKAEAHRYEEERQTRTARTGGKYLPVISIVVRACLPIGSTVTVVGSCLALLVGTRIT